MGGGSSKIPDEQELDIGQENKQGMNAASINLDMRTSNNFKLMDGFLQIHEGTLVGLVVVVVVVMIITLVLYGFSCCWCGRIHRMCGGTVEDNNRETTDMMEQGKGAEKKIMFK